MQFDEVGGNAAALLNEDCAPRAMRDANLSLARWRRTAEMPRASPPKREATFQERMIKGLPSDEATWRNQGVGDLPRGASRGAEDAGAIGQGGPYFVWSVRSRSWTSFGSAPSGIASKISMQSASGLVSDHCKVKRSRASPVRGFAAWKVE